MRPGWLALALLGTALGGAAALVAPAQGAPRPAPRPAAKTAPPRAATQCLNGERVFFSCPFGARIGSVCGGPGALHYRFGPKGKPAIDITNDADWQNIFIGRIVGGGGGYQDSLRFSRGDYDYIVYIAEYGPLTQLAGKSAGGIEVERDGRSIASFHCPDDHAEAYGNLTRAVGLAPADRGITAETDDHFMVWY
ncbi:MAG: hypothetical protein WC803_13075 [Sphingomonas sp.]